MSEQTPAYLRDCLAYDAGTGAFVWKRRPGSHFKADRYCRAWNSLHAGKPAGMPMTDGRIIINLDKRKLLAHRVAWAMQTGAWPQQAIDHIDRDHANNVFSNLRECTLQQNQFNRVANRSNKTGMKGVSWDKKNQKYVAKMCLAGKTVNFGRYSTASEAKAAYDAAAKRIHGDFAGVESLVA